MTQVCTKVVFNDSYVFCKSVTGEKFEISYKDFLSCRTFQKKKYVSYVYKTAQTHQVSNRPKPLNEFVSECENIRGDSLIVNTRKIK